MNLDDLTHFTMKEWRRMSTAPTETEVERAKAQLKASLLLGLDGTTAVAEDIGRQIVTSGKRMTPQEIEAAIDSVTTGEIQRVAQRYLWDRDVRLSLDTVNCTSLKLIILLRSDCRRCCWTSEMPSPFISFVILLLTTAPSCAID